VHKEKSHSTINRQAIEEFQRLWQADDGEEVPLPESQRCVACPVLIPQDWPLRFQHSRLGWPAMGETASTWGKTKLACSQVVGEQANVARGDYLKVRPSELIERTLGGPDEGMGAEQKWKKTKRFLVPAQKKTQPGLDGSNALGWYWRLLGRFRRYWCSTLCNYNAIFPRVALSYKNCSFFWIIADCCRPQKIPSI